MTDQEILSILKDIKPESYDQHVKLSECIKIWSNDNMNFADDYVSTLKESDVINRPCSELYEEYTTWCSMNYITDAASVKTFNKYVNYYFNVRTKASNGKRFYCK